MLFRTKNNPNPIRELNRKLSRYKKWWGDRQDGSSLPARRKKGSILPKANAIDDSFVYYEEV